MAKPGDVLAQRYRLVKQLGAGGMGTVWRAEHVELGTELAVKLILPELAASEATLARFKREAKAAAALRSPHVVQIFDYGVESGTPYIAMELLEGESLGDRLGRMGRLPPSSVARILAETARAVDKAHAAGILHRDLKPDNIFLCRADDGSDSVKVLDFGVAKALKPDMAESNTKQTRTGAIIGSPAYMSPEQMRGHKTIDHRADLWSLGVIAYECLVGSLPFKGESLGDLVLIVCSDAPPVPSAHGCRLEGFDAWFERACARAPDDRFGSAREMAHALRALLGPAVNGERAEEAAVVAPAADRSSALAATVQTGAGLARTENGARAGARGRGGGRARLALAIGAGALLVAGAVAILAWPGASAEPAAASSAPTALALETAGAARSPPTALPSDAVAASAMVTADPLASALPDPSAPPATARPTATPTVKAKPTAPAPSATGAPKPSGPRNYGF